MDLTSLVDAARRKLTVAAFDYIAGGADDELTLADNEAAWQRLRLRPRALRDVSDVRTGTTVLRAPVATPVLAAPTSMHRLAHDDGELATARAVATAESVFVLSMMATRSIEEVAEAAPDGRRWFQLYVHRDRGVTRELMSRAAAAGFEALVLTVDAPIPGNRRRDRANAFELPAGMRLANLDRGLSAGEGGALEQFSLSEFEQAVTADVVCWVVETSGLPLVVKGVLRGDDARSCVAAGASAVAVSNHGGRQLDTAVATADALPEVAESVGGDVEVYVDGGIRSGREVLKALALGARAVLVGRPLLWGLAARGQRGVQDVMEGLTEDLRRSMCLAGVPNVGEATSDLVTPSWSEHVSGDFVR